MPGDFGIFLNLCRWYVILFLKCFVWVRKIWLLCLNLCVSLTMFNRRTNQGDTNFQNCQPCVKLRIMIELKFTNHNFFFFVSTFRNFGNYSGVLQMSQSILDHRSMSSVSRIIQFFLAIIVNCRKTKHTCKIYDLFHVAENPIRSVFLFVERT